MILLRFLLIAIIVLLLILYLLPVTSKERQLEKKTFKTILYICCTLTLLLIIAIFQFKDTLWQDKSNVTRITKKIQQLDNYTKQLALTGYDFNNISPALLKKTIAGDPKIKNLIFSKLNAKFAPMVANIINQSDATISVKLDHLSAEAMLMLIKTLNDQINLQQLDITRSKISNQTLNSLLEKLQYANIITLKLNYNELGDQSANILASYLQKNPKLKTIALEANKLTEIGAKEIFIALQQNTQLQTLSLWGNNINNLIIPELAKTLQINHSLVNLNLGYNKIADASNLAILAASINNNTSLKTLNLKRNPISQQQLQSLITNQNLSITF